MFCFCYVVLYYVMFMLCSCFGLFYSAISCHVLLICIYYICMCYVSLELLRIKREKGMLESEVRRAGEEGEGVSDEHRARILMSFITHEMSSEACLVMIDNVQLLPCCHVNCLDSFCCAAMNFHCIFFVCVCCAVYVSAFCLCLSVSVFVCVLLLLCR